MADSGTFSTAVLERNPAWAQLLGLCPLLAVSSSVVNALGLAAASAFVVIGSNVCISALRRWIPDEARLPCFVLIIATCDAVPFSGRENIYIAGLNLLRLRFGTHPAEFLQLRQVFLVNTARFHRVLYA